MNTHTLVNKAVNNSSTRGRKRLRDRLFARWFSQLVYAQIWEDPLVDIQALQLQPGDRVLTIASGGCNALAYLACEPQEIHAVDVNGCHLALLALKRTAFCTLPDYPTLLEFLGDADREQNSQRFEQYIAPQLPQASRQYWETTDWRGQPRYRQFSQHLYRHGLLGRFIGASHTLGRLLGGNLARLADAANLDEQQALFDRHLAPLFDHPLLRFLAQRPSMLYSMGIPPAQFEALRHDAAGDLPGLFRERMRRLACDFPLQDNPYAQQAFARRYDTSRQSALPMYLQQQHYEAIRRNCPRLHAHHSTLTDFLCNRPSHSLDAYLFLDAQDWMDDTQLNALWREVTRTADKGARVVFRTGGSASPLEKRLAPQVRAAWHTDPHYNRQLHQQDRSAIYGGVHLYTKLT